MLSLHLSSSGCGAVVETSRDLGLTWQGPRFPRLSYGDGEIVSAATSHDVFVALTSSPGGSQPTGKLISTLDGGRRWLIEALPCPAAYRPRMTISVPQGGGAVWLACFGQPGAGNSTEIFYRTIDRGTSWVPMSSTLRLTAPHVPATAPPGDLETLYATSPTSALVLTVNGGLFVSHDGGSRWSAATTHAQSQLWGAFSGSLDFVDHTNGWVSLWITVPGYVGLWRTTNGGVTWSPA